MKKLKAGGSAFPETTIVGPNMPSNVHQGMTLRDYFAAKAMQGIAREIENEARAARWCYQMADAMLEAREE